MDSNQKIELYIKENADKERAERVKEIVPDADLASEDTIDTSTPYLELSEEGLSLRCDDLSLRGDFESLKRRLTKNNLQSELLVKAAKLKGKDDVRILDATAGLGEDSIVLAAAGFKVTMYEYDEIIFALLEDSVYRASHTVEYAHIANKMTLKH